MRKIAATRIVVWWAALTALAVCCTGLARGGGVEAMYGVRGVDRQLIIRSLDLGDSLPARERGKFAQQAGERLAAAFQNKDRSIGVLRVSIRSGQTRRALVRIVGTPQLVMDVSDWQVAGLASSDAISSILVPASGLPIAFIAHYSDTPPFSLATLDLQPG